MKFLGNFEEQAESMACTKALGQEGRGTWGSLRNCHMATGVLEKTAGACALQGFGGSILKRHLLIHVHCSIINNSQEVKATQIPTTD